MLLEQEPRPPLQTLHPQQPAPLPISGHTRNLFLHHHQQPRLLAEEPSSSQQAAALQQPETVSHEPRPSRGQAGFAPLPLPYDQQSRGSDYLLGQQLQSAKHGGNDDGLPDAERQALSTLHGSSSQWDHVLDPAMYHDSIMNAEAAAVQARGEDQQADAREPAGAFQQGGNGHWQGSVHASVDSVHASVDSVYASVDAIHQGRGSKRQAPARETAATAEADSSSRQVDSSNHQLPHVAVGTPHANDVDSQMQSPSNNLVSFRRRLLSVEPEPDRFRTDADVLDQLLASGHDPSEAQFWSVWRPAPPGSNAQDPFFNSFGGPEGGGSEHEQGHAVQWQRRRHQAGFRQRPLHPSQAGTHGDQGPSGWDPSQQDPSNELGPVLVEGAARASSNPAQAYEEGDNDTNSTSMQVLGGNADGSSWDPQQAIQQGYVARHRDGSELTWVRRFPDAAWRSITPATVAQDPDIVQTTMVRVINMRVSKSW